MAPDSVTAYVGWDAAAKKRRYVTKTVHGGKRQAEKALADFVTEVNKQQHAAAAVESGAITVKQVLDQWLEAAPANLGIPRHAFSFRSPAAESPLSPPR
jgi:hypothetical protein